MGLPSTTQLLYENRIHYTFDTPDEGQFTFTHYIYRCYHLRSKQEFRKHVWIIGGRNKALELINWWNRGNAQWKYVLMN